MEETRTTTPTHPSPHQSSLNRSARAKHVELHRAERTYLQYAGSPGSSRCACMHGYSSSIFLGGLSALNRRAFTTPNCNQNPNSTYKPAQKSPHTLAKANLLSHRLRLPSFFPLPLLRYHTVAIANRIAPLPSFPFPPRELEVRLEDADIEPEVTLPLTLGLTAVGR